jgi:hypothetical protein
MVTNVPISPEQRQAEAAPLDLDDRIAMHRWLFARDLWISQLTTEAPPVFTKESGERLSDPMSMLGPTLSWPLTAFISYKVVDGEMIDTPAWSFPWAVGLASVRHHCRRDHTTHWDREVWHGSLCWALVSATVRRQMLMERAFFNLEVSQSLGEDLLRKGFARIESKLKELQAKATEVVSSDAGRNDWQEPAHHQRHDQGGMHRLECPQCRGAAA